MVEGLFLQALQANMFGLPVFTVALAAIAQFIGGVSAVPLSDKAKEVLSRATPRAAPVAPHWVLYSDKGSAVPNASDISGYNSL